MIRTIVKGKAYRKKDNRQLYEVVTISEQLGKKEMLVHCVALDENSPYKNYFYDVPVFCKKFEEVRVDE